MILAVGLPYIDCCTLCTDRQCHDPPTPEEPICVELRPGETKEITRCPRQMISEALPLLRAARFADAGILPIAGGLLNQSQGFIEGVSLVWQCQAERRQEQAKRGR